MFPRQSSALHFGPKSGNPETRVKEAVNSAFCASRVTVHVDMQAESFSAWKERVNAPWHPKDLVLAMQVRKTESHFSSLVKTAESDFSSKYVDISSNLPY